MKLTIENYFDQVGTYMDIINADADFLSTYNFINKVTKNGKDMSHLDKSAEIRETFDLLLENLNKHTGKQKKDTGKSKSEKPAAPSKAAGAKSRKAPAKTASKQPKEPKEPDVAAEKVEHIPSDIALVKKYVSLHDKVKTYDQVLSIWRAFNKAIVERKVTKDSPFKNEIAAMNSSLKSAIPAAQGTGSLHMVIAPAKLKAYKAIADSVEKSAGVSLMLEYINISGKPGMAERADKLIKRIDRADTGGKLKGDRYLKDIRKAKSSLETYVNRETDVVVLNDFALSGIGEIAVFGCPCENNLAGFTRSQNAVVYKLIEEKVKNLSDCELDRAFADTVAPSLCKTIAVRLIQAGQLTMSLLRNPAKVSRSISLSGIKGNVGFDFNTEIMDMRLRSAAKKEKQETQGKHKNIGLAGTSMDFPVTEQPQEDVKIISAKELMNRKFRTIGLTGRYRQLIGDPEPGFSAMIYGKPKSGKSTLAIDFAKELTTRGKVLYCAFEEGHGYTLQDKVKRNNADVPGLDFANKLPQDFNAYRYVFIDSVSDAKLDEAAFGTLVKASKAKEISILGIFHATKGGNFRGGQTFAHDVDVLIRVEDGMAHAQGRFAAPEQIDISALTNTQRMAA